MINLTAIMSKMTGKGTPDAGLSLGGAPSVTSETGVATGNAFAALVRLAAANGGDKDATGPKLVVDNDPAPVPGQTTPGQIPGLMKDIPLISVAMPAMPTPLAPKLPPIREPVDETTDPAPQGDGDDDDTGLGFDEAYDDDSQPTADLPLSPKAQPIVEIFSPTMIAPAFQPVPSPVADQAVPAQTDTPPALPDGPSPVAITGASASRLTWSATTPIKAGPINAGPSTADPVAATPVDPAMAEAIKAATAKPVATIPQPILNRTERTASVASTPGAAAPTEVAGQSTAAPIVPDVVVSPQRGEQAISSSGRQQLPIKAPPVQLAGAQVDPRQTPPVQAQQAATDTAAPAQTDALPIEQLAAAGLTAPLATPIRTASAEKRIKTDKAGDTKTSGIETTPSLTTLAADPLAKSGRPIIFRRNDGDGATTNPVSAAIEPATTSANDPLRAIVDTLPPVVQSSLTPQAVAATTGPSTGDLLGQKVIDMGVSGQWIDRMAQEIAGLADGTGHSRFTLSPPHLGTLQVDMWRDQDLTNVRLIAETDEAARRLQEGRSALQADPRVLGSVTIEKASAPFDSSARDQSQQQPQSQAFGQRQGGDLSGQTAQQQADSQARGRAANAMQGDRMSRIAGTEQDQGEASLRSSSGRAANGRVRFA